MKRKGIAISQKRHFSYSKQKNIRVIEADNVHIFMDLGKLKSFLIL
jgi:hypothetical protein